MRRRMRHVHARCVRLARTDRERRVVLRRVWRCREPSDPAMRVRRRSTRLSVGDLVMVRWYTGLRYVGRVDVTGLPGRCVDVQFFADNSIAVVPYDRALRDY